MKPYRCGVVCLPFFRLKEAWNLPRRPQFHLRILAAKSPNSPSPFPLGFSHPTHIAPAKKRPRTRETAPPHPWTGRRRGSRRTRSPACLGGVGARGRRLRRLIMSPKESLARGRALRLVSAALSDSRGRARGPPLLRLASGRAGVRGRGPSPTRCGRGGLRGRRASSRLRALPVPAARMILREDPSTWTPTAWRVPCP